MVWALEQILNVWNNWQVSTMAKKDTSFDGLSHTFLSVGKCNGYGTYCGLASEANPSMASAMESVQWTVSFDVAIEGFSRETNRKMS